MLKFGRDFVVKGWSTFWAKSLVNIRRRCSLIEGHLNEGNRVTKMVSSQALSKSGNPDVRNEKNPTLRWSKYFRDPKYFRGTPFWDFWPLKVPKKWHFSSKTKIGPQFQFTGSWPKKSNFEGVKIFLGPKICLMYSILVFLTLESTKKWFVFIKNIKKFACWNIANFVMFLMKTNGTFKGQKS